MKPALISADWGTTSLRVYLTASDGRVLARRESADGILAVADRRFAEVLARETAAWRISHGDPPIVLSGMIGSRQGWVEAPYAICPVQLASLAGKLSVIEAHGLPVLRLVPGVATRDRAGRPDVMRGEETQILGALAAMHRADGLFLLPGTHSKWVTVEAGCIAGFRTYMTGEAFAALKGHTILGRLMTAEAGSGTGFAMGVRAGSEPGPPGALLSRLFSTRTLGLFDELPGTEISDYLSGLLIGAELAAEAGQQSQAFTVIASPGLAERYGAAARLLGLAMEQAPPDCVVHGHLALARAAGLVRS